MSLGIRLVEQARELATFTVAGRPRQDHLRRAVSVAYYGLFHFLIDQACRLLLGSGSELRGMRGVLARAFDHGQMKKNCLSFASGTLSRKLHRAVGSLVIPKELRDIASTFVTLQEQRHAADYDVLKPFLRTDAILLVELAEESLRVWPSVQGTEMGRLFLLALLIGDRVRD